MIDEIFYKACDLLREMIAIPSLSRDESNVADVVSKFLESEGVNPVRYGNNIYVAAQKYDAAKPTIMLNSHIDTVKPAEGWTRDPFTPETDECGRLYGLGSNDAGASVVSLIASFLMLKDREQPYNLELLISAEEEVSGKNGIESVIPQLPHLPDFAVVGEPTGMHPAIAEKGLMVLDGTIRGKAGHAARNEGINAIYKSLGVIDTLRNIKFPKESEMLGPVRVSVTQIESGKQHNVVPDLCRIVVDVRTTDVYTNIQALEMIRNAVPECELTPRSTRLNPSGLPANHPFVVRARLLGLEPFGSPTLSDQALMRWPSVKIGPGDSARSHTADEFIYLSEIRESISYYIHLLDKLAIYFISD